MDFKAVAIILLLSVSSSWGYSLGQVKQENNGDISLLATDYGPEIKDALNNVLAGLPDPVNIFISEEPIKLDLTEILKDQPIKIEGTAELTNITANGVNGVRISDASAVLDGILSPFPFDVKLNAPNVNLQVAYKIDILIEDVIPIFGTGHITIGVVGANLRLYGNITSLITTLKLPVFEYDLDLTTFKLNIDGLLDDTDFSETVSRLVTDLVSKQLLDPIRSKDSVIHKTIVSVAKSAFENLELTLSQLLDLLKPKP